MSHEQAGVRTLPSGNVDFKAELTEELGGPIHTIKGDSPPRGCKGLKYLGIESEFSGSHGH